jgi:hypothetical protein
MQKAIPIISKKFLIVLIGITLTIALMLIPSYLFAEPKSNCSTIQDGTITDSNGIPIVTGYDKWGYNYQAHMFNGYFDNYLRPENPVDSGDKLIMKWNDAWLSNKDCDGDGKLDRHFGFNSYIGSGAWLTNHQSGTYMMDGKEYKWTYFVKIVAVPADAYNDKGVWYAADGTEIGPEIWGEFAIVQEIYNDSGTGDHGISYKSPCGPTWIR